MELRRRFLETPTRVIVLLVTVALALAAMALQLSGPRHTATGAPGPAQRSVVVVGKEPDTADMERQPIRGPGGSTRHEDGILHLQS